MTWLELDRRRNRDLDSFLGWTSGFEEQSFGEKAVGESIGEKIVGEYVRMFALDDFVLVPVSAFSEIFMLLRVTN